MNVTTGSTTAPLRHYWGLNSILNNKENRKSRDDHRHHAVDALVVALTTPGMLQELSRWNKLNRSLPLHNYPLPWETFYRDARNAVESILVSQKQNNKTVTSWNEKIKTAEGKIVTHRRVAPRGQLHKETVYGKRRDVFGNEFYVVRKPLEALTPAMISKIVDRNVKDIVKARILEKGENPDAKKFTIPKDAFTEPLYMPNKKGGRPNQIKKVRIRENSSGMVKLKKDINQWVEPGSNHHVAIYRDEAGKLYEQVVTFYEAVERKKQGLPVIKQTHEKGYQLTQTLQINDMFLLGLKENEIDWNSPTVHKQLSPNLYRVQKLSASYYTFRHHKASTLDNSNEVVNIQSFKAWEKHSPVKVRISATGKIERV